jgi:polyisoprenoid-binding protein YceI
LFSDGWNARHHLWNTAAGIENQEDVHMRYTQGWLAALVLATAGIGLNAFAADTYEIDPVHSTFVFKIKHFNVAFLNGRINDSSGAVVIDESDPSKSSVQIELKTASIDTNVEKRDTHLKSADFFNVEKFPALTFKSKSIKKVDATKYDVTGDFTLLGVTKEITVPITRVGTGKDPWGGTRTGFDGTFSIKRSDYGMTFMLDGIGDEVQISLGVEGVLKK